MVDDRLLGAAERLIRPEPVNAGERAALAAWQAIPANDAAWQAVSRVQAESIALAEQPELLALRHATVARVMQRRSSHLSRMVAALAVAACVAIAVPLALRHPDAITGATPVAALPVRYATAMGQRLSVRLPDGSHLTLDTDSRVRVAYSALERRLVLEKGQALFDVAKHQSRPFIVSAGAQQVIAHGTQFDIRLDRAAMRVALLEGKVSVRTAGIDRPTNMVPDDVLTGEAGLVSVRHTPGLAQTLASWSDGTLIFQDEALGKAVAEINRYGAAPITIADETARRIRISGSFRTGETQPFLDALEMGFPVRVERQRDGSTRISKRH